MKMIQMKQILLLFLLLCGSMMLSAQTLKRASGSAQTAMIEKINAAAAGITSIQCHFTQVKSMSFLNDKVTSKGLMSYSGKGKLRWEYTTPYQYLFIISGEKVHIQSDKQRQTLDLSSSRMFKSIAQIMVSNVTGKSLKANRDFDVAMFTKGKEWVAQLTPKSAQMKKMFKAVRLHFNTSHSMVSMIEMEEPSGDSTLISLSDIKTNEPLPDALFTFK